MIVTDIAHLGSQAPQAPNMRKALDFLCRVEGQTLPEGRVEIDGDNVFASVQSYQTQDSGEWKFEGHRKYIDIQYITAGEEVIGWTDLACVTVKNAYDPAKDAWTGTADMATVTAVRVSAGHLAVFFPEDAHAPKRAAGQPQVIRKIVVKVATGE